MEDELLDLEMKKSMEEIEKTCHEAGHQLGEWQKDGQNGQRQLSNRCEKNGCGLVVGVKTMEGYGGMVFRTIGRYGFPGECAPN